MNTVNVASSTTRKFPTPYHYRIPSDVQRTRNGAIFGICRAEHLIGYYTEKIAEINAQGPLADEDMEFDRLDDLQLWSNTIASHQRKLVTHQKVLASLPAQA